MGAQAYIYARFQITFNGNAHGGSMNMNGRSRMIGAMLAVAFASGAICADAQAVVDAPAQMMTVAASPPGTRPDRALIRDVRRALRRVPQLDDSDIHIRARLGVVTLTGTVPESWQISRAANAARSVHGVRGVANRLSAHHEHGSE